MEGWRVDGSSLVYVKQDIPEIGNDDCLIRLLRTGICNTVCLLWCCVNAKVHGGIK